MQVEGKAAIVTGGGTGVGRATALKLGRLGCSVLVNYRSSRDEAQQTAGDVGALGVKAVAFRADVADDAACRATVEAALEAFGRLDVLVNNAGTTRFIAHTDLDAVRADDWDQIMAVNLRGPFQCARAARAALAADGGGEIVNVSSVAGIRAVGSSIPYCASKAALNNLTLTLARSLAPEIRVNAVAPSFITGRWLEEGLGAAYEPLKAAFEEKAPLGRVCDPDDVADAIVSLVTGSDLVTGQILACEGGSVDPLALAQRNWLPRRSRGTSPSLGSASLRALRACTGLASAANGTSPSLGKAPAARACTLRTSEQAAEGRALGEAEGGVVRSARAGTTGLEGPTGGSVGVCAFAIEGVAHRHDDLADRAAALRSMSCSRRWVRTCSARATASSPALVGSS